MGKSYGLGVHPCVAIGKEGGTIEAHVKQDSEQTISSGYELYPWPHMFLSGENEKLLSGGTPSCSLADDNLFVVVNKAADQDNLQYRIGKMEKGLYTYRIDWCGDTTTYDTGVTPSVSMNDKGDVVEVHKSQNYDNLHYRVGSLNKDTCTISWGASHKYDTGVDPVSQ